MSFIVFSAPGSTSGAASFFPDDAAEHWHGYRAFGHCRVCVSAPASVASSGHAPTSSTTSSNPRLETIVIVDGYLADSSGKLHEPKEQTPAARIANLIQREGYGAVSKLTGSFVAIIVQPDSGDIRVWRDRLGGRTAYWHCWDGKFFVASSVSAIAAQLPRVAEDRRWLSSFFALQSPAPAGLTAFADVQEALPGEWLEFSNGALHRTREPFPLSSITADHSVSEWIDRFSSTFTRSVQTVVPPADDVAIMLSGGLDSGPSACIAAAELSRTGRKLHAVSWALAKDNRADESEFIQLLCAHLQQPLDLFDGSDLAPFGDLRTEMVHCDFPLFNGFRPLILECYRRAREAGAEVIINAAAGDRIYPHWNAALLDLWRRKQWSAFAAAMGRLIRYKGPTSLYSDPHVRHWIGQTMPWTRRFSKGESVPAWLTQEGASHLPAAESWPPEAMQHRLPQYAQHLIGQSMAQGMAHENAFSRRYGLDRRDPFHNEELVRLMLEMPVAMSWRGGVEKWVMRQAMRGKLPEPLRTKKRTGLLNTFFAAGFNRHVPRIEELLFAQQTDWQAWVRPKFVRTVLAGDTRSDKEMLIVNQCIGHALWRQRLDEEGISIW